MARCCAAVLISRNTFRNSVRNQECLSLPTLFPQNTGGFQKQLHISGIAMTEGVVVPKAFSDRRTQRGINLPAPFIVQRLPSRQARQPNACRTVAPCSHRRFSGFRERTVISSEVPPICGVRVKECAFIG